MIANLYEGFRQYPGWKHENFGYFYLHMLVESNHVEWIRAAVVAAAQSAESRKQIEAGAADVLALLGQFWKGLNRLARQA